MVLGNRYVTMLRGFPKDTTSGEVIKSEDGVSMFRYRKFNYTTK